MKERTVKGIADLLEEQKLRDMKFTRTKYLSFQCESKDESVLLAAELYDRGYKAKTDVGIVFPGGDFGAEAQAAYLVLVTGRRKMP